MDNFVRKAVRRHPVRTQRALEILPGFVSWSLILFPVWGSLIIPEIVAYYIIAFSIYWLYRSITMAVLATISYYKLKASMRYPWQRDARLLPDVKKVHHIVVIPTYKEPLSTIRRTLDNFLLQTFSLKQVTIVLSFEEREGPEAHEKSAIIAQEYKEKFGNLLITFHPDIQGEVKGKSANTAWGAKQAKALVIDTQKLDMAYTTISSNDADALFHPQYLSSLTYHFLTNDERYNCIWQPTIMFYNNIWRVPAPVRVLASIFSVTQMFVLMRQDRLINFSTYSLSLALADEIGYWDTDVIPEDYRMFFKAYFAKKGKLEVIPLFIPVYADAAEAHGFWNTMFNQYEQIKRWAWGVSDDAYIIKQWILAEGMPFWEKTIRVLKTLEDHFLWPVNWFAVTIGALLPPLLNEEFNRSILGKTLPQVTSGILTVSLLSLLAIFIIDAQARPPKPGKRSLFSKLLQPLEFLLLPVIGFFFSALPGIDAHTRLMFGKYIEYRVTEKV
jgi:glycosyltransferase involved in cell wall biosynthesis